MTQTRDDSLKAQTRQAAIVIFVAAVVWMAGSWIGGAMGAPVRFAFLLDLACLAAFVWAMVVLLKVRRARAELEN